MMKRVLTTLAVLAVTVLSSFAADVPAPGMNGTMNPMMPPHPEMKKDMMRNPQHLLMMAYHRNLVIFGRTLEKVARQGETVPREFARTTIAEMRRSTEEMEKYRAESLRNVPTEIKEHGDMHKKMDQHLVSVKTHLRELEDLAKSDRIQSQEVIKHLQFIFKGCEGMDSGHGRGVHGKKRMHGCQCQEMMPEHRKMREDMVQKMKAQDAELTAQVETMKRAPEGKKLNLLADLVTLMVRQRAAMTAHMEKAQKPMPHHEGASMAPSQIMKGPDSEDQDDDEDAGVVDNSDEEADKGDINMQNMNMQDMNE